MKKGSLVLCLALSVVLSAVVFGECKELQVSVEVIDDRPPTGLAVSEPAERLPGIFEKGVSSISNNWVKLLIFFLAILAGFFLIRYLGKRNAR
jgi:hypothetical protein